MKIGAPFKKPEPIIEEPIQEEVIEPVEIEEPEIELEEQPKEPEKEKTVHEDVMKVVETINGLKGEKDVLAGKVSALQELYDDLQKRYEESGIQNKKYEEELKNMKDAIKAAIYD